MLLSLKYSILIVHRYRALLLSAMYSILFLILIDTIFVVYYIQHGARRWRAHMHACLLSVWVGPTGRVCRRSAPVPGGEDASSACLPVLAHRHRSRETPREKRENSRYKFTKTLNISASKHRCSACAAAPYARVTTSTVRLPRNLHLAPQKLKRSTEDAPQRRINEQGHTCVVRMWPTSQWGLPAHKTTRSGRLSHAGGVCHARRGGRLPARNSQSIQHPRIFLADC